MDSMETALHAIDTMVAAMEKSNEAVAELLASVKDQGAEMEEIREVQAALALAFSDHLRLDSHGAPGESVRVLRQP